MPSPSTHVIAGGTHFHVRPHLALAAPAYRATGHALQSQLETRGRLAALHLTAMAGGPKDLDTNADLAGTTAGFPLGDERGGRAGEELR